MMADIAQGADGHLRFWGIDGHAAAIGVVDGYHVIHVGILGKQFPADALGGHVQRPLHALHRGLDTQEIAGASIAALGVAVAHPGPDRRLGQIGAEVGAKGHIIQAGRRGQAQHMLVDPLALGDGIDGIAQNNAIADDGTVLEDIDQGNFMRLGNDAQRHHAGHQLGALGQFLHGDGHVVLRLDLYVCTHGFLLERPTGLHRPAFGRFLSYQAGLLVVKLPAGDQELHADGVVPGAQAVFHVNLVGLFDLLQIHVDAKAGL